MTKNRNKQSKGSEKELNRRTPREDYAGAYNGHYRGNGHHSMDHKDGNYGGLYTRSSHVKSAGRREAYDGSDDYSEDK